MAARAYTEGQKRIQRQTVLAQLVLIVMIIIVVAAATATG